jgi:hypothetical protein
VAEFWNPTRIGEQFHLVKGTQVNACGIAGTRGEVDASA